MTSLLQESTRETNMSVRLLPVPVLEAFERISARSQKEISGGARRTLITKLERDEWHLILSGDVQLIIMMLS